MRTLFVAVSLVCVACITAPAFAKQTRLALVVGNGAYENAPLANPPRDAEMMADALGEVGFKVFKYVDLNRRDMKRAFLDFGRALKEASGDVVAMVYYAGHGAQIDGVNYLIPVEAQIRDAYDVDIEGVRAASLLGTMRDADTALNIIVLDACRNNPFESSGRSATRGLARMDAPTGTLLAYSTAPGRVAEDGDGSNSTYTRSLARAIREPGAKVEEVFKFVRVNVMDRTQGRQVPWESSSLTGDFVFVDKPAEPERVASLGPSDQEVEIEFWKSIATTNDPALFQSYIERYPEGLFRSIAEQRVASLTAPKVDTRVKQEQQVWNSVKDTDSVGILQGFLQNYPDGVYAPMARARISELEAAQSSRAAQPRAGIDEELVMWDSVKNARTQAELQVYLNSYPDGRFADLAKAKMAALSVPQPAAGTGGAKSVDPEDFRKVVFAPGDPYGAFAEMTRLTQGSSTWTATGEARGGQLFEVTAEFADGEIDIKMVGAGGIFRCSDDFDPANQVVMTCRFSSWYPMELSGYFPYLEAANRYGSGTFLFKNDDFTAHLRSAGIEIADE